MTGCISALAVSLPEHSGVVKKTHATRVFSYNSTVADKDAVSLTMPVRLESYGWAYGIHPLFEMHIPEGHLKADVRNKMITAWTAGLARSIEVQ